jgi:hypothetical protein
VTNPEDALVKQLVWRRVEPNRAPQQEFLYDESSLYLERPCGSTQNRWRLVDHTEEDRPVIIAGPGPLEEMRAVYITTLRMSGKDINDSNYILVRKEEA